jgi:hypothetical protein
MTALEEASRRGPGMLSAAPGRSRHKPGRSCAPKNQYRAAQQTRPTDRESHLTSPRCAHGGRSSVTERSCRRTSEMLVLRETPEFLHLIRRG